MSNLNIGLNILVAAPAYIENQTGKNKMEENQDKLNKLSSFCGLYDLVSREPMPTNTLTLRTKSSTDKSAILKTTSKKSITSIIFLRIKCLSTNLNGGVLDLYCER